MLAAPAWVAEVEEWAAFVGAVAVALSAVVTIGYKLIKPSFLLAVGNEIDKRIKPFDEQVRAMESTLREHRDEARESGARVEHQVEQVALAGRAIVAMVNEQDVRLSRIEGEVIDLNEQVASHVADPNAHQLPAVGGRRG